MTRHFVLLAAGPDRIGLRDAVESWLRGNNTVAATNLRVFSDSENVVFLRIEFSSPTRTREQLRAAFATVAAQWELETWHIQPLNGPKPRVMVLVTKADHCLTELLARHQKGRLPCDLVAVAGNHTDLQEITTRAGVPFTHIPWPSAEEDSAGHEAAHSQLLQLVKSTRADALVLARFMRIIRPEVSELLPTINIHHALLPAFVGARAYHQAHDRGVKEIGASAHYVTPDLDQGPILAQGSTNIDHLGPRPTPQQLEDEGRATETRVLLTALTRHFEGVIVYRGGTVHIAP